MHHLRLPLNILIQKVYVCHKNFEFPFALQRCEYSRTGPRMSRLVARNLKIEGHQNKDSLWQIKLLK